MAGLIIGYGRAGKRHGKLLDELGIDWFAFDPLLLDAVRPLSFPSPETLEEALLVFEAEPGDFALIATPPRLHLAQIRQCLDAGLPVLCEKPLCGLGQLAEADALLGHPGAGKVMVGFNYRYHPKLQSLNGSPDMLICRQQRDNLPEWGLLLDHCSHDLDIMRSQISGFRVASASHCNRGGYEWWTIEGLDNDGLRVSIEEWVGPSRERTAKLVYPDKIIDLNPDPVMYVAMWQAFLSGQYAPGLADAIETQRLLEKCEELAR